MNREQVKDILNKNKSVTLNLENVEIIFVKEELKYSEKSRSRPFWMTKVILKDSELGSVFISSFSNKFRTLHKGQKISLKVTITGIGDANSKYPDPLFFARAELNRGEGIVVR